MPTKPKTIWMVNPYAIPPTLPGGTRHYDFAVEMTRLNASMPGQGAKP